MPELGSEIGGYVLESVLGEGGMGTVYLARGREGGICAVKVLSRRLVGDDPSFATRFKREVQYAEALDHPHVLELYEAGETPDGTLFFAMQYIDGHDLGVLLRRDGALSLLQALAILGPIADALDRAHANGLVHRDVKPGNIIVEDDAHGPYPYLTDFGLSKNPGTDSIALTQMGQLIGTLAYTAPEEILATEPRGHLVDVYSLGCVMYEALTGAPPFVRERDIDVLYAHVGDPRPRVTESRSDLPAGIDDVVARAMAISAPERYATCTEFVSAARALLGGPGAEIAAPVEAPAPEPAPAEPAEPAPEPEVHAEPEPEAPEHPSEDVDVPPGALRLAVRDGLGRGRVLIVEDEVVIGRQSTLDGALAPDHSISRRHARITRAGDGSFIVEDEHSRNGTFVNGERLEQTHVLRTGDLLKVGATVFEATVPELAVSEEPVPEEPVPEEPVPEEAVPEEAPPEDADYVEFVATSPEQAAPEAAESAVYEEFTPPSASALPAVPDAPKRVAEFAVEAGEAGSRLTLRLEFDPDAGELVIAIDGGASVRFVRGSDGWHPVSS